MLKLKQRVLRVAAFTLASTFLHTAAVADEGKLDVFLGRPAQGSKTLVGGAPVPGELNLTERIFEADMGPDIIGSNRFFTATEPGFFNAGSNSPGLLGATNPAGALPLIPGESFIVEVLMFDLDGPTSDLFFWDGAGGVNFVPASAELILTQTDGVAGPDGSIDDHPFFDIDDPLSDDLPAGGIYLASLRAQLDGLEPSDPVFVLFVTGEEFEPAVELADAFLRNRLVPEPASAVLAGLALLAATGAWRTRRPR